MSESAYRRAALAYGVLGVAILIVTVADPALLRPERRADLVHLLVGLPFFVLFALAVAFLDRPISGLLRLSGVAEQRARRIGRWWREKLVMLLTLSALVRTLVFLANGFGQRPRFSVRPPELAFETVAMEPRMLVNAALMAMIALALARASWLPFLRRLGGAESGDRRAA